MPTSEAFTPRPEVDPRPHNVAVRLSDDELRVLDRHARQAGLTRSDFVRGAIGSAVLIDAGKLVPAHSAQDR